MESIGGTNEVHPHQPGAVAPPRGPCRDLRTSRGPKVSGQKNLSPRFLLAHHAMRRRGGRPQVRRMLVLCSTNPFTGTGAPNHPNHLVIRGLGSRHGGTPQEGSGWLHSPTCSSRQVYQVDRGQAHHQHPLGKKRSNSSSTSSTGSAFPTASSLTTGLTSPGRSS